MTNQQIEKQIPDGNSAMVKRPPSPRVYTFKDVPPEAQEQLLRLQNGDGDILRETGKAPFSLR